MQSMLQMWALNSRTPHTSWKYDWTLYLLKEAVKGCQNLLIRFIFCAINSILVMKFLIFLLVILIFPVQYELLDLALVLFYF